MRLTLVLYQNPAITEPTIHGYCWRAHFAHPPILWPEQVPAVVWIFFSLSQKVVLPVLYYRFEKLAQSCKKDLDILQLAQAQGLDPPSHHFEERTFKIVRYGKPRANHMQTSMEGVAHCLFPQIAEVCKFLLSSLAVSSPRHPNIKTKIHT